MDVPAILLPSLVCKPPRHHLQKKKKKKKQKNEISELFVIAPRSVCSASSLLSFSLSSRRNFFLFAVVCFSLLLQLLFSCFLMPAFAVFFFLYVMPLEELRLTERQHGASILVQLVQCSVQSQFIQQASFRILWFK